MEPEHALMVLGELQKIVDPALMELAITRVNLAVALEQVEELRAELKNLHDIDLDHAKEAYEAGLLAGKDEAGGDVDAV